MDITAALTEADIVLCSDAGRACGEVGADATGKGGDMDLFEESLRLKNTLDAKEDEARVSPSWEVLSVLVNCEFRLYSINQHTPLRNNPFLSHWVETIQRLENQLSAAPTTKPDVDGERIVDRDIWIVRLGLIKALLQSRNVTQFTGKSPRQLYTDFVELQQRDSFDLRPYIRMLEEEDIYERTPEPPEPHASDNPRSTHQSHDSSSSDDATQKPPSSKPSNFQQWKQDVLTRLKTSPGAAIPELTHLPIELSSLDFLTTLLQDQTLQAHNINPAPIISDYIQHALRLTEQMGEPPSTALASSSSTAPNTTPSINAHLVDHGREAQTRAIKLLLLFMRNLIRKDLVGMEAIYFEIQEICVRYVWIREVREFRAFIEGVEGGEGRDEGSVRVG